MTNPTTNQMNFIALNAAITKMLTDFWNSNRAQMNQGLDLFIQDINNRHMARHAVLNGFVIA